MAREHPFIFYSRYFLETLAKMWRYLIVYRQGLYILKEVMGSPDRWSYRDLAITAADMRELETLDLYHATSGGKAALARKHRDDAIRAHASVVRVTP